LTVSKQTLGLQALFMASIAIHEQRFSFPHFFLSISTAFAMTSIRSKMESSAQSQSEATKEDKGRSR